MSILKDSDGLYRNWVPVTLTILAVLYMAFVLRVFP